jgi:hypothetical protein
MGEVLEAFLQELAQDFIVEQGLVPLVITVFGVIVLVCGLFNWDWVMTHSPAAFFVQRLTRPGTRLIAILLGAGLIFVGLVIAPAARVT